MIKKSPIVLWQLAVGYSIKALSFFFLVVLIYPVLLLSLGKFWGSCFSLVTTIVTYYVIAFMYFRSAKDWLGIELIKSLKDRPSRGLLQNLAKEILKNGDVVAALVLPVFFNPIVTVIYLRKGAWNFGPIKKKDRLTIIASSTVFSVLWLIVVITGMSLYDILKHKLTCGHQ
ncbi:MAG: hypothetical protein WCO10_01090 [bacterium]